MPRAGHRDRRRLLGRRRARAARRARRPRRRDRPGARRARATCRSPAIIDAARASGADAVHPGYGFLSENAGVRGGVRRRRALLRRPVRRRSSSRWARRSRRAPRRVAAGLPVVPGETPASQDDAALRDAARRIGFPLLVKASAGGGGKGMRVVRDARHLGEALAVGAARGAGGVRRPHALPRAPARAAAPRRDPGLRRPPRPRRAPLRARLLDPAPPPEDHRGEPVARPRAGAAPADGRGGGRAGRARMGYVNAGTVEFLVEGDGDEARFYFLEMNTRLQVEHPVTEMVTGVDLVRAQLRVASGEPLPWADGAALAARPRDRVPRLRGGPGQRLPAAGRAAAALPRAAGPGHPRGQRRRRRRRDRHRLRPDDREARRVGRDARDGAPPRGGRPASAIRSSAFAPTSRSSSACSSIRASATATVDTAFLDREGRDLCQAPAGRGLAAALAVAAADDGAHVAAAAKPAPAPLASIRGRRLKGWRT